MITASTIAAIAFWTLTIGSTAFGVYSFVDSKKESKRMYDETKRQAEEQSQQMQQQYAEQVAKAETDAAAAERRALLYSQREQEARRASIYGRSYRKRGESLGSAFGEIEHTN